MSYQCEVKEQPAQKTLSIRTRAAVQDLPRLLEEGFGAIAQYDLSIMITLVYN